MAPLSPPPGWMCYSDPHWPRPRLSPAAARSSGLGSPWPPAAGRGRRSCRSPSSRPAAARPRGRGLDQHAATAIARSLPDYFTSDVARPGMPAAVRKRTASMTSFAGAHGTAHHTPCWIQVLPRRAVPPNCSAPQSSALAWPPCRDRIGGSARRWLISCARSRPTMPEPVGDDRIAGPLVRLAVLRLACEPRRGVRCPVAGPRRTRRLARHVLAWERVANVPALTARRPWPARR